MSQKITLPKVMIIAAILLLLVGFAVNYQMSKNALSRQLIQSPQVHDVYVVEKEILHQLNPLREKYVIAQVSSIDDDVVTFKVSNFVYMKVSDAIKGIRSDKLLTRKFFSQQLAQLPKSEIVKHWQGGRIHDVGRSTDGMHLYGGIVIGKSPQPVQKERVVRKGEQANQQAISYYQGNMGYKKDLGEAFRLFEQAAKQGHPYAQVSLAQMYRDGESVEVDEKTALYWFAEAKKQGVAMAQEEYSALCQKVSECEE